MSKHTDPAYLLSEAIINKINYWLHEAHYPVDRFDIEPLGGAIMNMLEFENYVKYRIMIDKHGMKDRPMYVCDPNEGPEV